MPLPLVPIKTKPNSVELASITFGSLPIGLFLSPIRCQICPLFKERNIPFPWLAISPYRYNALPLFPVLGLPNAIKYALFTPLIRVKLFPPSVER